MSHKSYDTIDVYDEHNDYETFIPYGIIEGDEPGPTVTVIGGVHGSEYAAHEGVHRFWQDIDPAELAGTVRVVLATDVAAMMHHAHHTNPIDGKNLNRHWPGDPDGTLTEVIAHTVTERFIEPADYLIDCHGGEFNEYIDLFTISYHTGDAELDEAIDGLATAAGLPFIQTKDVSDGSFGNTTTDTAIQRGIPAITLEAGGCGRQESRHIRATYLGIINALRHLDLLPGTPARYAGEPIDLEAGNMVRTESAGIYSAAVENGDWVEAGDTLATVYGFDGSPVEEVTAPDAGVVIMTWGARVIGEEDVAALIGVLPEGA